MSRKDPTEVCGNCQYFESTPTVEQARLGDCAIGPARVFKLNNSWCGQFKRFETQEEMPDYGRV